MRSFKDFDTWPDTEKLVFASTEGAFLMRRLHGFALMIELYYVDDFFIEVWNSASHANIPYIRSLKNNWSLEPYLHGIDIRESLSALGLSYED